MVITCRGSYNYFLLHTANYHETDLDIGQPVNDDLETEEPEPVSEVPEVPVRRVSFQLDNLPDKTSGYLNKGRRLAKTAECFQFLTPFFLTIPIFSLTTRQTTKLAFHSNETSKDKLSII